MEENAHHLNGPSSWSRRFLCPGSANAERGLPDESSEWSREGTAAHKAFEECLEFGLDAYDLVGDEIEVEGQIFEVTLEMAEHLQGPLDRVRGMNPWPMTEAKVDLSTWVPGCFGTLDTGDISPDLIFVGDLKYGPGVHVSARKNPQLMAYALGLVDAHRDQLNDQRVLLRIEQPRRDHVDEWETTIPELLKFGEEAALRIKATEDPDAPRFASVEGCQFCKAAATCPTLAEAALEIAFLDLEDLDKPLSKEPIMPDPEGITPERRAYAVKHAGLLSRWLETLKSTALKEAQAGRMDPGLKMVAGRGSRNWTDEQAAEALLRKLGLGDDQIFNQKLTSPAQAEKMLGKGRKGEIQPLVEKKPGNPTLAAEDDPRPALENNVDRFDDLEVDDLI